MIIIKYDNRGEIKNTPSKANLKRGTQFNISLSFSLLGIIGRYGLIGYLLVT